MAREFPRHMISARPFANSVRERDEAFLAHQAAGFTTWRLAVDGLVARPALTVACRTAGHAGGAADHRDQLRGRLVVHRRVDRDATGRRAGGGRACSPRRDTSSTSRTTRTPGTASTSTRRGIRRRSLAWGMNDGELPVPFGGPLRMRVPRQLGYKSTKYINRSSSPIRSPDSAPARGRPTPRADTPGTRGSDFYSRLVAGAKGRTTTRPTILRKRSRG